KADDVGLHMAQNGWLAATRTAGRGVVKAMPRLLKLLSTIGTAAMLWVGGAIVIHGMEQLGFGRLEHLVHNLSLAAGRTVPQMESAVSWLASAIMSGSFGLLLGLALIPVGKYFVTPV